MAAKSLTLSTQKGGEGKTSVSIFLSSMFAHKYKKRVLGIDLDPQGNYSMHYLAMQGHIDSNDAKKYVTPPIHPEWKKSMEGEWDGISSSVDIFAKTDAIYPYPTKVENLDILPAFSQPLKEVDEIPASENEKVMKTLLDFVYCDYIQDNYDLIIFDTRPSKGALTSAALHAASHLIMPCKTEYFGANGIYGMLGYAEEEQDSRPYDRPLELVGILPNYVDNRTSFHKDTLKALSEKTNGVVIDKSYLSHRIRYAELMPYDAKKTEPYELSDKDPAKQEVLALCEYVNKKIFGGVEAHGA